MGKLSRQRKLKSCDPFYRGQRPSNDDLYNLPLSKACIDNDQRSKTTFVEKQMALGRKYKNDPNVKGAKTNKAKTKVNPKMQKQPGESNKKFFDRLDREVSLAVNKSMAETKKLRGKRKIHLKQRDEKKKSDRHQKAQEEEQNSFKQDVVRFGDVVEQPPQMKFKPRNAPAKGGKNSSLKLASLLQTTSSSASAAATSAGGGESGSNVRKSKRPKDMTPLERAQFEKTRQRSIDMYREAKKQQLQQKST